MDVEAPKLCTTDDGTLDWKGNPAEKKITGKWPGSFPMLGVEVAETFTYFGIASNLVTYMTKVLHQGLAKSARDVNNWSGTLFVSSVLGAFISDSFWGHYKTMSVSIVIYCLGLAALTISASVKSFRPPQCPAQNQSCSQPTLAHSAFLYLSLYTIAISAGSLKSNLIALGADQFDLADDSERKQKHSFFNWLTCSIATGGIVAVSLLVYVQDHVGWGWGFGMLLVAVLLTTPVFIIQTPKYRYRPPEGSPLTRVTQVLVAAFRNRNVALEDDKLHQGTGGKTQIVQTSQFSFLNKAAMKVTSDSAAVDDPWRVSTVTRVEEVKLVVRVVPIWISTLVLTVVASQSLTFFVRQGITMNNRIGSFNMPPASMLLFALVSQLIFMPIYDRILVPLLRKYTQNERGVTLLQKIGLGMVGNSAGIMVAAVVEMMRKRNLKQQQQISIFWLVPQYVFLGIGEGLAAAGTFEFFHSQAPDGMQSLGTSFALANAGVGNFVSSVVITCVKAAAPSWLNDDIDSGHIDYFYWLLAVIIVTTTVSLYVPLALWYKYKPETYTAVKD